MADVKNCSFPGCEAAGVSECALRCGALCREHAVRCDSVHCDAVTCKNDVCISVIFHKCGQCPNYLCSEHAGYLINEGRCTCDLPICSACEHSCDNCGGMFHRACLQGDQCAECLDEQGTQDGTDDEKCSPGNCSVAECDSTDTGRCKTCKKLVCSTHRIECTWWRCSKLVCKGECAWEMDECSLCEAPVCAKHTRGEECPECCQYVCESCSELCRDCGAKLHPLCNTEDSLCTQCRMLIAREEAMEITRAWRK
jgi:hypothetical protein